MPEGRNERNQRRMNSIMGGMSCFQWLMISDARASRTVGRKRPLDAPSRHRRRAARSNRPLHPLRRGRQRVRTRLDNDGRHEGRDSRRARGHPVVHRSLRRPGRRNAPSEPPGRCLNRGTLSAQRHGAVQPRARVGQSDSACAPRGRPLPLPPNGVALRAGRACCLSADPEPPLR